MLKKVTLMIILLVSLIALTGEQISERGLGFSAGTISGIGFSYRQYIEDYGFQVTCGLTASGDEKPDFDESISGSLYSNDTYLISKSKDGWDLDGSLGVMFISTLRKNEHSRFYYFVGGSVKLDRKKKYYQTYERNEIDIDGNRDTNFHIVDGAERSKTINNDIYYYGPGIGLDLDLSKYLSLAFEWPLTFSSEKEIIMYIPQCSLNFKF